MRVVSAAQMRMIEERAEARGTSSERLMENAGCTVAKQVSELLGDRLPNVTILILVGPGNNGGDGLVAGRYLHDWGAQVNLLLWSRRLEGDDNLDRLLQRGIEAYAVVGQPDLARVVEMVSGVDIVVDALFGTGKVRPISDGLERILAQVAKEKERRPSMSVVTVDLPSGMDADTGSVDPATLSADLTVTFQFPKLGLFQFPGAGKVGRLVIADIGIPEELAKDVSVETISREWVKKSLPPRPAYANKGTFGKVLVIGGSLNYIGAPCLSCMGAMRVGAGLVTLAVPKSIHPIVAEKLTEATFLPLPEAEPGVIGSEALDQMNEVAGQYDVILIGPGIGRHFATVNFIRRFLLGNTSVAGRKIVLDADGLYALSRTVEWWRSLAANLVITPHPGEMARLTGKTVQEVESDRFGIASKCANDWRIVVTLKGAYTIISSPQGSSRINTFANPVLATAGTGDVLSGAIAGLIAQGLDSYVAASCATYVHGWAGEILRLELGDAGAVAGDLLSKLPLALKITKE